MTTTTPKPRKSRKRLPPTTEMGRQLMKQGREKMVEEAARTAEALVNERRQRAQNEEILHNRSRNIPTEAAVQRGLLTSIVGSLASENITPIIDVQPVDPAYPLEAWTDFHSIRIRYHMDDDPRIVAAVLRGLMYHEGGHIRWSLPFATLREMVCDRDGRTGVEMQGLQRAHNILEDQRMETAVVSDSPRKAAFFTPAVMTEILETVQKATNNYPLLVWRRYLPKHIRDACRAAFVANQGEVFTQQIEECVDRYVKATTAHEMWNAVTWFAELTDQLQMTPPSASYQHKRQQSERTGDDGQTVQQGGDPTEKLSIPIDPTMDANPAGAGEDEGEEEGAAAGGEDGDEEGGTEGASQSEEASDDSGQGAQGHGAGARSEERADHDPLTQDMLNKAAAKAEQDRYNDRALDGDMNAFNDALEHRGSKLAPYTLLPEEDTERQIAADALADDMVQSFHQATIDRIPSWVSGQRSGMLDVGRFMNRQPGDMEYFTQWTDDDIPGFNMAVSVLLDYSGSMANSAQDLAQAGYACKVACDRLEIPCTVVLWDDDAEVLWDGEEHAEMLPVIRCTGNTDPSWALADLDNQRFGKERHLVLIMTDGIWSFKDRSLAPYVCDGRMMMGVGYKPGEQDAAVRFANKLKVFGCPDAFPMTDLNELPWMLEDMLLRWS